MLHCEALPLNRLNWHCCNRFHLKSNLLRRISQLSVWLSCRICFLLSPYTELKTVRLLKDCWFYPQLWTQMCISCCFGKITAPLVLESPSKSDNFQISPPISTQLPTSPSVKSRTSFHTKTHESSNWIHRKSDPSDVWGNV